MTSPVDRPPLFGKLTADQAPIVLILAGFAALAGLILHGDAGLWMVVAAPVGVIGLWFAAQSPRVSLAVMILGEVTNISGVLATRVSFPIFTGSLILGVAALLVALRRPLMRSRLNRWTLTAAVLLGIYLFSQFVATTESSDVTSSTASLTRAVIDCVFIMVVLMLIQITDGVWTAAATFVVPFAVISALTLVNQLAFGGTFSFGGFAQVTEAYGEDIATLRYGGPLPDSNFWGRHLVLALPIAGALLVRASRSNNRWHPAGWGLALIAILAGIYLTQSRGTFLATGVAIVVFVIACGPTARRWGLIALPLLGAALLLAPGVGDRLVSAAEEVGGPDTNSAAVDPSILGRLASQEMAVMMFEERPVFGYGPSTFEGLTDEFTGRVPTAVNPKLPIEAPHNLYLQTAAESGILGLLGWSIMVLGFVILALLRLAAEPRAPDRVLTAGACAAIVAWSAASVTLHLAYFRTFGIVLAIAAALAPRWPVTSAARALVRGLAIWLVAVLVGTTVAWGIAAANTHPAYRASQRLTVKPVGVVDGYYFYALDIRTRSTFYPTVALVLHPQGDDVTVVSDVVRGTLTFTAVESDRDRAVSRVSGAVARATATADQRILGSYVLTPVDPQVLVEKTTTQSTAARVAAVVTGIVVALVCALVAGRLLPGRRPAYDVRASEVANA
ncbi:O-antigen ligase family protein [Gordonia bronchialis]|uniref:O-antigen ligase family protein n=1 Tax=Gordonia bronchialis TaxID=2054 RepID=UPI00226FF576|nr:O-antigen ligase family protein [Gordonia bronchialis]